MNTNNLKQVDSLASCGFASETKSFVPFGGMTSNLNLFKMDTETFIAMKLFVWFSYLFADNDIMWASSVEARDFKWAATDRVS